MATTRLNSSAPAHRERDRLAQPLRELLQDGQRDGESVTLAGVQVTETPRQRVVPLRTDPLEQATASVGRDDPTHAPIHLVVHPANEPSFLQPRDEAGKHGWIQTSKAGQIGQADRTLLFRGDKHIDFRRGERTGRSRRPKPPGHAGDGAPQAGGVEFAARLGLRFGVRAQR
ncbi:MAG TPA: hypothetical protein VI434_14895 [Candidatus Dormibacteraeota bacterium]